MSTVVQDTSYLDQLGAQDVVDSERKSANQRAAQCPVHDAPCTWHSGDQLQSPVELRFELPPEPRTLRFVPRKSLCNICRGFDSEFKPIRHDCLRSLSLARSSSHDSPGPGAGSSSRRSSSSLCQSGTGTSSGVKLSQRSSSSLRRSSTGSRRISSRRALGVMQLNLLKRRC